jgi:hypothetical protein
MIKYGQNRQSGYMYVITRIAYENNKLLVMEQSI